jgi:biopolymer transport protein ExbD
VLGCATFFAARHWYNTRIFVPIDMPVSLAAGHIRTGPFRLNLSTDYWITVDVGDWWRTGWSCTATYPNLRTRWVLYQNGSVVDQQDDPRHGDWTGFFEGKPGVYQADIEVLSDFKCLDPGHPRLRITALNDDCDAWVFVLKTLAVASVFIGIVLLVFLPSIRFARSFERTDFEKASEVTASPSVGQNFPWARRLPLRRPITALPNFGLIAGITFAALTMVMMHLGPMPTLGLWVHLLNPGQSPAKSDLWTDPVMVGLVDGGAGKDPKLLVNSKQVGWDDLRDILKRELSSRPDWTVYVEADECIPWVNVTAVVDIARGLHAKVVLLTNEKQKPCQWPVTKPMTM